ncbi:MAG: hypothetical protein AAFP69_18170 [Planctomycetota bacterium]
MLTQTKIKERLAQRLADNPNAAAIALSREEVQSLLADDAEANTATESQPTKPRRAKS